MKTQIYKSDSRGVAEHGWLSTRFSFSFAHYYDANRMGFGALRVLNDDTIAGGKGFGMHPHENMEIVTIVLEGAIEHKDSTGSHGVTRPGEVQRMSAGTGVMHSEFNHSQTDNCKLLQIWVHPRTLNEKPSYEQTSYELTLNKPTVLVANNGTGAVHFNQEGQFVMTKIDQDFTYQVTDPNNGVFVFVISGKVTVDGKELETRDAAEITDATEFVLSPSEESHILFIEVPMNV